MNRDFENDARVGRGSTISALGVALSVVFASALPLQAETLSLPLPEFLGSFVTGDPLRSATFDFGFPITDVEEVRVELAIEYEELATFVGKYDEITYDWPLIVSFRQDPDTLSDIDVTRPIDGDHFNYGASLRAKIGARSSIFSSLRMGFGNVGLWMFRGDLNIPRDYHQGYDSYEMTSPARGEIVDARIVVIGQAAVPEPGTFVLAALGLAGIALLQRGRVSKGATRRR